MHRLHPGSSRKRNSGKRLPSAQYSSSSHSVNLRSARAFADRANCRSVPWCCGSRHRRWWPCSQKVGRWLSPCSIERMNFLACTFLSCPDWLELGPIRQMLESSVGSQCLPDLTNSRQDFCTRLSCLGRSVSSHFDRADPDSHDFRSRVLASRWRLRLRSRLRPWSSRLGILALSTTSFVLTSVATSCSLTFYCSISRPQIADHRHHICNWDDTV